MRPDVAATVSSFEENSAILGALRDDGTDLTIPYTVEFSHVFASESSARAFAQTAERDGFAIDVQSGYDAQEPWEVTSSIVTIPSIQNVALAQERLDAAAHERGGRPDGWGFLEAPQPVRS